MQDRKNLQSSYIPPVFQTNGPKYLGSPYQYTALSVRKRISGRYCYSFICKCVVASESEITQSTGSAVLFPSAPPAAGTSWGDGLAPIVMLLPPRNVNNWEANHWEITAGFPYRPPLRRARPFLLLCTIDPLRKKILKAQHICSSVHSEGHMGFIIIIFFFLLLSLLSEATAVIK